MGKFRDLLKDFAHEGSGIAGLQRQIAEDAKRQQEWDAANLRPDKGHYITTPHGGAPQTHEPKAEHLKHIDTSNSGKIKLSCSSGGTSNSLQQSPQTPKCI